MKPHRRLATRIRMLPRVPRQISLRLPRRQPPIDRRHVISLCDWKRSLDRAPIPPRHILRAQNRPVILLERKHPLLEYLWFVVAVKRNHVRHFNLNLRPWFELLRNRPITFPHSAGQRLRRMRSPRPSKTSRKQREHQLILVLRLQILVPSPVFVICFVPNAPAPHPSTFPKTSHTPPHI